MGDLVIFAILFAGGLLGVIAIGYVVWLLVEFIRFWAEEYTERFKGNG